jgi:hypothetical protein
LGNRGKEKETLVTVFLRSGTGYPAGLRSDQSDIVEDDVFLQFIDISGESVKTMDSEYVSDELEEPKRSRPKNRLLLIIGARVLVTKFQASMVE